MRETWSVAFFRGRRQKASLQQPQWALLPSPLQSFALSSSCSPKLSSCSPSVSPASKLGKFLPLRDKCDIILSCTSYDWYVSVLNHMLLILKLAINILPSTCSAGNDLPLSLTELLLTFSSRTNTAAI